MLGALNDRKTSLSHRWRAGYSLLVTGERVSIVARVHGAHLARGPSYLEEVHTGGGLSTPPVARLLVAAPAIMETLTAISATTAITGTSSRESRWSPSNHFLRSSFLHLPACESLASNILSPFMKKCEVNHKPHFFPILCSRFPFHLSPSHLFLSFPQTKFPPL